MPPVDRVSDTVKPTQAPREPIEVTVVVPVKDEEARLPASAPALLSFVQGHGAAEIVLSVDAGCSDETPALADDLDSGSRWVRAVRASRTGKGNALLEGVRAAHGRLVLMSDSDLSVDPGQWQAILAGVGPGTMVIADRRLKGSRRIDDPPLRAALGRAFNIVVRALVLPGLRDTQCGCKAMTADDARRIMSQVTTGGWAFDVDLLARARRAGIRVEPMPVTWTYQPGSRMTPRGALKAFLDVLRVALTVGRPPGNK